jgi:Flp pilus assembly protein TadG
MKSARDGGSTIPLVLGFFILALLMVAGSIAAGDAFVQRSALQSLCDSAAVAAASSADADSLRHPDAAAGRVPGYLRLAGVEAAIRDYLAREPDRAGVVLAPTLAADHLSVTLACTRTSTIAFGSVFGLGAGITDHVTSRSRAPIDQP